MRLIIAIAACLVWALPAYARMTHDELKIAAEACSTGVTKACEDRFLTTGYASGSLDQKSLLIKLVAACDAGDLWSCTDHAAALMWAGNLSDPQVYLDLTHGCVSGDGWGCYLLGRLQLLSPLEPENGYLALHDARRAECQATADAAICTDYAFLNQAVGTAVPDGDIQWSGLVKACEKDEPRACAQLSFILGNEKAQETLHSLGRPIKVNQPYSAAMAQKACDLGNPIGCWNLSTSYRFGAGLPKDAFAAQTLANKACQLGLCYVENRSWLAGWLESQNVNPDYARPILRAIVGAAIGLLIFGLPRWLLRRARQNRPLQSRGVARPSFWLAALFSMIFCGTGFVFLAHWVQSSQSPFLYIGLVCIILGIGSILGLLPAYTIFWNEQGVHGPVRLWVNPFSNKKMLVEWHDIALVGTGRGGNSYLSDLSGRRIYWNIWHANSGSLTDAIGHHRPDLKFGN